MPTEIQLADPEHGTIDDIVNLAEYPLDQPESARWHEVVATARAQLADDGCLVLAGFLTDGAISRARAEIGDLAPKAKIRHLRASVYGRNEDESDFAVGDPRRISLERTVGHLTRDQLPPDLIVARLYVAPAFKAFIAACLGAARIYEYADPLAGLIVNIVPPGGILPWHYDTNEFVVTVMTQQPDAGGDFMFIPNLRWPGDENVEGLAEVLDGSADDLIRTKSLEPGDLQIFKGRYALHQVDRVAGASARHVAVFGYADRPGVIGPADRTRAVYGRVTEAHLVADELAGRAPDGLIF